MRIVLILFLVLYCGCAAQNAAIVAYDDAANRTMYTSPKLLAGNVNMSAGLASGHRVMMQAFAECDGQGCRPDEVEIAFFNDTSGDLNLDYRRIQISFGTRSVEWEDYARITEPAHYMVPRGEFLRLPVKLGDFEAMATAPEVHIQFGLTGTTVLRVPFNQRQPLRTMAEAMSGSADRATP